MDDVRYRNTSPWPAAAAESGSSLERINAGAYGNDPINWKARFHGATPGRENNLSLAPTVSAGPDLLFTPAGFPLSLSLVGTVVDDGPPESLAISWSQLSGPATVSFSTTNLAETTMAFPKAGVYVVRLSAHDGEWLVNDDVAISIDRPNYPVMLVSSNSAWKYLDNGSNQGTVWRQPGFNDSSWATGNAQFGYGDNDEATVISFGPVSTDKYITSYYRKTFQVTEVASITGLTVGLLRDDGAVVYLNGTEVFRSNLTNGPLIYTTLASNVVGGADENTFYQTNVNSALLVNGTNLLAVELHQANATGSDAGFDLQLSGFTLGTNQPPAVTAGDDLVVTLPQDAVLRGQPADDGLPLVPGELQLAWSKSTGPGDALFANSNAATTTVSFAVPGVYGLRLTAFDGAFNASGFMNVYVLAETYSSWAGTYFSASELNDPNFGGTQADPDGDGYTNEQEFAAGTNPRDAQSLLCIEAIAVAPEPGVKIRFAAAARRAYSIQYRNAAEAGNWRKLSDVPSEATTRPVEILDSAPTNSTRYYRIVAPIQP